METKLDGSTGAVTISTDRVWLQAVMRRMTFAPCCLLLFYRIITFNHRLFFAPFTLLPCFSFHRWRGELFQVNHALGNA